MSFNYENLSIRVMDHAIKNNWNFVVECCTEPEIERSLEQHNIRNLQDALMLVSSWGRK
jgi:hypothetical protein